MDRIYLYVPYEERNEVKKLGARFDDDSKCWYIHADQDQTKFERWLGDEDGGGGDDDEGEFSIVSKKAFVACAKEVCSDCDEEIDVVCIYCENGLVDGEPYTRFTVCNITSMDDALEKQLKPWPFFHRGSGDNSDTFINHCSQCKAPQEEFFLHSDPAGPFFTMQNAGKKGADVSLTPLKGTVQLNGDEGFEP